MELTLAIIFGFMVFMIILNKGHLYFFSITSFLITAAISLGIGYGIALFILAVLGPLLKIALIVIGMLVGASLLINFLGKGGS